MTTSDDPRAPVEENQESGTRGDEPPQDEDADMEDGHGQEDTRPDEDGPGQAGTKPGEDDQEVESAHMSDFMEQVLTRISELERENPRQAKRRTRTNETTVGREKRHKGDSPSDSDDSDEDTTGESGSSAESTRSAIGTKAARRAAKKAARKAAKKDKGKARTVREDDPFHLNHESPAITDRERRRLAKQESLCRPADPKTFAGGNVQETRQFHREVENVFQMQPHVYWTQMDKYRYAMTRLRGECARTWGNVEKDTPVKKLTWTHLKGWMVDKVEDPANRRLTNSRAIVHGQLQEGQRIEDFAARMEDLLEELNGPPLDDFYKCVLLTAALPTGLFEDLRKKDVIPWKKRDLLQLIHKLQQDSSKSYNQGQAGASSSKHRHERGDRSYRNDRERSHRDHRDRNPPSMDQGEGQREGDRGNNHGADTRDRQPGHGSPATGTNTEWTKQARCYNCNQLGHILRHCRNRKQHSSQGPGKALPRR